MNTNNNKGEIQAHGFRSKFKATQFFLYCKQLGLKARLIKFKTDGTRKLWIVEVLWKEKESSLSDPSSMENTTGTEKDKKS
jgi:hypothetical protein